MRTPDAPPASPLLQSVHAKALTARPKLRARAFVGRMTEPSNPDYLAQKHKLDHLASFVTAALTSLTDTMDAWAHLSKQHSNFAMLMAHTRTSQSMERAARLTSLCARDVRDDVLQDGVVPDVMKQLKRFLTHVRGLQERQRDVRRMKREYEMSMGRVRKGAEGWERVERGRIMYEAMVKRMAERMKEANDRGGEVVRTVRWLYWLVQEKASACVNESTEEEMGKANAAEPLLCYVRFCQGLKSPTTMFNGMDLRAVDRYVEEEDEDDERSRRR